MTNIFKKSISYSVGESIRKYRTSLPVDFVYCNREKVGKRRIMTNYELIIVLEGQGFMEIDGSRHEMKADYAALFPPDKFVYYESAGEWRILALGFAARHQPFFERFNLHNSPAWQIKNPQKAKTVMENIIGLSAAVFSGNNLELLDVNCEALLLTIADPDSPVVKRRQGIIDRIFAYINENYESMLKIDDLCRRFGISRSLFFKLWRGKVQIPPNKYITQLKMRRARDLLRQSDMRIGEIAATLGFEDQRYFCRRFKQFFKNSPQKYRSMKLNAADS